MFGLVSKNRFLQTIEQFERNFQELEDRFIRVLTREIANIIINEDPDRFLQCYREAKAWEESCRLFSSDRISQECRQITMKYPFHADLDLLGTNHWVPYKDSYQTYDIDDFCEHYLMLCKFLILIKKAKKTYYAPLFPDSEVTMMERVITEHKHSKAKALIDDAFKRAIASGEKHYEDEDYEVVRLIGDPRRPQTPDIEYGFFIKKLGSYFIMSYFRHEDDHFSRIYSQTDAAFSKDSEKVLRARK
jgi:hypothetical protein